MEDALLTAVRLPALTRGIIHFLSTTFKGDAVDAGDDVVAWCAAIAKDTLEVELERAH